MTKRNYPLKARLTLSMPAVSIGIPGYNRVSTERMAKFVAQKASPQA